MTKIEALRKEADLREMCEGTTVQWWQCMKGFAENVCSNEHYAHQWLKESDGTNIRYALAIVENKPAFAGDELYYKSTKHEITKQLVSLANESDWSWNPPRPKTVLVEQSLEPQQRLERE